MITYGTNPGMAMPIDGPVPGRPVGDARAMRAKALAYMGSHAGEPLLGRRWTWSSSGAARTRACPTCAPRPACCAAATWPPACACWSCPARSR